MSEANAHKVYILVRSDLSPGAQIVQAAHAMSLLPELDGSAHASWREQSNYLVVLGVDDEAHMKSILEKADAAGATYAIWREPDIDNEITSVVFTPSPVNTTFLSSLPLAGKAPAPKTARRREADLKRAADNGELVPAIPEFHRTDASTDDRIVIYTKLVLTPPWPERTHVDDSDCGDLS